MDWDEFRDWVEDAITYLQRRVLPDDKISNLASVSGSTLEQCRTLALSNHSNDQAQNSQVRLFRCRDTRCLPQQKKPLRVIWYRAPFIFSQAHAGSKWLSQSRIRRYDTYAAERMREAGLEILETSIITQSRMEDSWDGLHFLRMGGDNDPGHGLVSSMVQQALLNAIFPACQGADLENL